LGEVHRSWPSNIIILTAVAIVSLLILGTWQLLKGTLPERQAQIYLFAAVSLQHRFHAVALFSNFLPDAPACFRPSSSPVRSRQQPHGRLVICAIVMLVCIDTVRLKLDIPFALVSLPRAGFDRNGPLRSTQAPRHFDACRHGTPRRWRHPHRGIE